MKFAKMFPRLSVAVVITQLVFCTAGFSATERTNKQQGNAPIAAVDSDKSESVRIHLEIPLITGDQSIDVCAYDHQTFRPLGEVGGGAGNKVQQGPVTISKRIDCYTPVLLQIHLTGQHLKELTLRWSRYEPNVNTEYLFFTIKLTDVTINAIHTWLPNQHDPSLVKLGDIEEVSFTYAKIEMSCGGI